MSKELTALNAKAIRCVLGEKGLIEPEDELKGKNYKFPEDFVYECIDKVDTKKECIIDKLHTRHGYDMTAAEDIVTQMLPKLIKQGRVVRVRQGFYKRV